MEPPGLFFLRPIVNLLGKFLDEKYNLIELLGLPDDAVKVYYTTYVNEFKCNLKQGERSITEAVNDQLTPGTRTSTLF